MDSSVLDLDRRSAFAGSAILHPLPTRPGQLAVGSAFEGQGSVATCLVPVPRDAFVRSSPLPKRPRRNPTRKTVFEDKKGELRKGCNCKRSNCLKLYCECFASKEYCRNCNCTGCYNSVKSDLARSLAVKEVLGRNPNAFKSKVSLCQSSLPPSKLSDSDCLPQNNKVPFFIYNVRAVFAKNRDV